MHVKKLEEICAHKPETILGEEKKVEQLLAQANMSKYKTHEFTTSEKENQIRKENQLLLEKLVEITHSRKVGPSYRHSVTMSPHLKALIASPELKKKLELTKKISPSPSDS